MSYQFGQFRKNQLQSYLTPIAATVEDVNVTPTISTSTTFVDKAIQVTNGSLTAKDLSGNQKSYYLRFKIYKREDGDQTINIRLVNTNLTKDNVQNIETIVVESGSHLDYFTFEFIISPSDTHSYNQIYFELERDVIDYDTLNDDGTYGRKMVIEKDRLDDIYNVINYLNSSIDDKGVLKQIGVQGPPGLLMSINGEEIRVGRSGIYEINNKINVTFIGFIVEDNEKYFILDYQY